MTPDLEHRLLDLLRLANQYRRDKKHHEADQAMAQFKALALKGR